MSIELPMSDPVPVVPAAPPRPARAANDTVELTELRRALAVLPVEDYEYDEWRDVIFAIHHATDGSDDGLTLALEWSERCAKHEDRPGFLENEVWPYIDSNRENPITARTIFAKAFEHGYEENVLDDFNVITDEMVAESIAREKAANAAKYEAKITSLEERFRRVKRDELVSRPPAESHIDKVMNKGIGSAYGASGSGKSFEVLDMVAALDRGIDWNGCQVRRKHAIVYVVAEGAGGYPNRFKAYEQHHGVQLDIESITAAPNLGDDEQFAALLRVLKSAPVDVMVLDTWAQVTAGLDENSGREMSKALARCKQIHEETGATVLIVSHVGKDAAKGQRGWSGVKAALDFEWEVTRNGEMRQLKISKMKDGRGEGAVYPFRLVEVLLGVDDEGNAITSCVVEHLDSATPIEKREPTGKGSGNAKFLLKVYADAADLDGTVNVIEWRNLAHEKLGPRTDSKGFDRRGNDLRDALDLLVQQGFITITDGLVTLC